jgi:hypothetical protein
VGKEPFRHKVVSLEDLVNVCTVDTNRDSHHHMLRSLDNLAIDSKQIRPLEGLETKVVVGEISIVNDGRIKQRLVVHDDLVDIFRDHGGVLASLGVDPLVEVVDDC